MRYSQYGFGNHEFSDMRVLPDYKVVEYDFEDLDAVAHTLKIPVEAGVTVLEVIHLTQSTFDGGTPALTIGDADDADGFSTLAEADLAAGVIVRSQGFFAEDAGGVATKSAYAHGKHFAANGYILLTHAADLTQGAGKVLIGMLDLSGNWRVPEL